MKITVTGMDVSSEAERGVMRRVLLALSRFGPRVRKVSVRLAERANPLGGVDRHCAMRAQLQTSGEVSAEAIDGEFEGAAARAAAQLSQRVRSSLDGATSEGSARPADGPGRPAVPGGGRRRRQ